jgi:signal peptidase I
MSALATQSTGTAAPRLWGARVPRLAERAATAVLGLALLLLALLLIATVAGYSVLIDHSDSMRPAIRAGDMVFTESVPAVALDRGDIVTFSDRALGGRLITHRVVGIRRAGSRIAFLTRGDANPAAESWTVPVRASLGRVVLRVPELGRATAWMSDRWVRTILLGFAAAVLGTALLRRIWGA